MPAELDGGKLKQGGFRLTSYEIGVLYSAAQQAAQVTGDSRYASFAADRLMLIAHQAPIEEPHLKEDIHYDDQMRKVLFPTALDDAGAMCASFIRLEQAAPDASLRPVIDRYVDYVMNKQYRLKDGTLARIRPHYNTVWLDDMYMGVPCLAWYGRLTGDARYYDEALRQMRLFRDKMWVDQASLFRHGWVEEMEPHPFFPWGRANGWAVLTMCEVLDAIPADYPGREEVVEMLRRHLAGLCAVQDKTGFWHQLLNDPQTYLETSATAIYTYCLAHAICEGWVDQLAYGAQTLLAWHAVQSKVNALGQVEGTCVGSGMGFDAAFYAARPVHVMAAHGYGPVLWAGSETIRMLRMTHPKMNDSAVHFYPSEQKTNEPIFSEERAGVAKEEVLW